MIVNHWICVNNKSLLGNEIFVGKMLEGHGIYIW